eukprot:COSAG02_NODE_1_length_108762_cov_456.708287_42_plen_168_part_00
MEFLLHVGNHFSKAKRFVSYTHTDGRSVVVPLSPPPTETSIRALSKHVVGATKVESCVRYEGAYHVDKKAGSRPISASWWPHHHRSCLHHHPPQLQPDHYCSKHPLPLQGPQRPQLRSTSRPQRLGDVAGTPQPLPQPWPQQVATGLTWALCGPPVDIAFLTTTGNK